MGDTAQDDADEISAELPDNSETPNVEDDQSEPPVAELEDNHPKKKLKLKADRRLLK